VVPPPPSSAGTSAPTSPDAFNKIIGDESVFVGHFVGAPRKNCSQVARNIGHRATFSRTGVDGLCLMASIALTTFSFVSAVIFGNR
jgi:hypothetical protein